MTGIFLDKSITIITGHYGSGKSEFSINLAIWAAKSNSKVILGDLDLVNPYFCSRESQKVLEEKGIELIAPSPNCHIADVPALPQNIMRVFNNKDGVSILDVGGNHVGARVLSGFYPQLSKNGYNLFVVLNANRPQTSTLEGALQQIREIENSSRLKATAIVNNTHLCGSESLWDIEKGNELAEKVSNATGLPIFCHVVSKKLAGQAKEISTLSKKIFPIEVFLTKPWE